MAITSNRRALLGAMAFAPAAAVCAVPAPALAAGTDPKWTGLVADFRTKHAAWYATIELEEQADHAFHEAAASLPPKPEKPGSTHDGDILDKTQRELRDAGRSPAHEAAWADYEREHAAWQAEHDALRERVVGPAKAACQQAYTLYAAALSTLFSYRVTNLHDLSEKIDIVVADYDGCEIPPEYVADILADVHHLARRA